MKLSFSRDVLGILMEDLVPYIEADVVMVIAANIPAYLNSLNLVAEPVTLHKLHDGKNLPCSFRVIAIFSPPPPSSFGSHSSSQHLAVALSNIYE